MGTYTPIADLRRFGTRQQRGARSQYEGGRLARHTDTERPENEAAFRCPSCGDASVVAADCGRCEVPMYDRTAVLELPRSAREVRSETNGAATGLKVAGGLTVLMGAAALVLFLLTRSEGTGWHGWEVFTYGMSVPFGLIFLAVLAAGTDGSGGWLNRVRRRLRVGARDRRLRRAPATSIAALPARVDAPVRIRGRVQLEHTGAGQPELHVVDGTRRVRIQVDDDLVVYGAEGDVGVLTGGDEVEVVGTGDRPVGAGQSYREATGELVLRRADIRVL